VRTQTQALAYLGEHFRLQLEADPWETNEQVGERLLAEHIFVHIPCDNKEDKFNLLVFMMQKLYALVTGHCAPDNPDSNMHHEILLPGLLIQTFVREKLREALLLAKRAVLREHDERPQASDLQDPEWFARVATGAMAKMDIGRLVEYFLATGNLASKSGLGLSQTSGFTIVADKLNYMRYLSHFRSVHRGAYFAELRTTTVRKLLPESWGFLCPVHTPDGSPCGLLNHLAAACYVDVARVDVSGADAGAAAVALVRGRPEGARLRRCAPLRRAASEQRAPAPETPERHARRRGGWLGTRRGGGGGDGGAARGESRVTAAGSRDAGGGVRPPRLGRGRVPGHLPVQLALAPDAPSAPGGHRRHRAHRIVGAGVHVGAVSGRRRRRQRGARLHARGNGSDGDAERHRVVHAVERLQPEPAEHVPVPDGEADHGSAHALVLLPPGHQAVPATDAAAAHRAHRRVRPVRHR
jgi:hypothetical protein